MDSMNELQKQRIRDGIIHFTQRPALGAFKPTPCPLKPSSMELIETDSEGALVDDQMVQLQDDVKVPK